VIAWRPFTVLVALLVAGCAGESAGDPDTGGEEGGTGADATSGDAAGGTGDTGGVECGLELGEPCFGDEQCASGICLVSEFAPFGICTVPCQAAPGFCIQPDGTQIDQAWCVAFPEDDFKKLNHPELNRFCVPMCTDLAACQSIHPAYELCGEILYKGNPLFPSDPVWLCQAPSAIGKTPVDPFTCADWDVVNPGNANEKFLCKAYCDYLSACQYYPPSHNEDCCHWYCYLELVGEKGISETYKDLLVNYTNFFKANEGNAQQCEGEAQYGPPPLPDAKAPTPVEGECE
jgi:hypothetical protein